MQGWTAYSTQLFWFTSFIILLADLIDLPYQNSCNCYWKFDVIFCGNLPIFSRLHSADEWHDYHQRHGYSTRSHISTSLSRPVSAARHPFQQSHGRGTPWIFCKSNCHSLWSGPLKCHCVTVKQSKWQWKLLEASSTLPIGHIYQAFFSFSSTA